MSQEYKIRFAEPEPEKVIQISEGKEGMTLLTNKGRMWYYSEMKKGWQIYDGPVFDDEDDSKKPKIATVPRQKST